MLRKTIIKEVKN